MKEWSLSFARPCLFLSYRRLDCIIFIFSSTRVRFYSPLSAAAAVSRAATKPFTVCDGGVGRRNFEVMRVSELLSEKNSVVVAAATAAVLVTSPLRQHVPFPFVCVLPVYSHATGSGYF